MTLETVAYANSGDVLKVQALLSLAGEHIELEDDTLWKVLPPFNLHPVFNPDCDPYPRPNPNLDPAPSTCLKTDEAPSTCLS